jgi:hypothetical protein
MAVAGKGATTTAPVVAKRIVNDVSWWPPSNLKFEEAVGVGDVSMVGLSPFECEWGNAGHASDSPAHGQSLQVNEWSNSCGSGDHPLVDTDSMVCARMCGNFTCNVQVISRGQVWATGMMEVTTDAPHSPFNTTQLTLELLDVHDIVVRFTCGSTRISSFPCQIALLPRTRKVA